MKSVPSTRLVNTKSSNLLYVFPKCRHMFPRRLPFSMSAALSTSILPSSVTLRKADLVSPGVRQWLTDTCGFFRELKHCRSNFCFSFTLSCTSELYSASVARRATRVKNLTWPKSVDRSRLKPPLPQPGTTLPLHPNEMLETFTRSPMRQPTPSQRHVRRRPCSIPRAHLPGGIMKKPRWCHPYDTTMQTQPRSTRRDSPDLSARTVSWTS